MNYVIYLIRNEKKKLDNNVFDSERTKRKKADIYTGISGKPVDESIYKTPTMKRRVILKGTKT